MDTWLRAKVAVRRAAPHRPIASMSAPRIGSNTQAAARRQLSDGGGLSRG